MNDHLGVGLVGLGRAAERLAQAVGESSHCRLASAWSRSRARTEEFAKQFKVPHSASSFAELLANPEVKIVVIASRNCDHLDQVLACVAAGKHVMCEKPLGLNASESERMAANAVAAEVRLSVGFHHRFHPLVLRAKEAIDAGTLGAVRHMKATFLLPPTYDRSGWRSDIGQSGGGAMVSGGIHLTDALSFVAGSYPQSAQLITVETEVEERAVVVMTYADDVAAVVETSRATPFGLHSNTLEIFGEAAYLRLVDVFGGPKPTGYGYIMSSAGNEELTMSTVPNLYAAELDDLAESVMTGTNPRADAESGLQASLLLDGLYAHRATPRPIPAGTKGVASP